MKALEQSRMITSREGEAPAWGAQSLPSSARVPAAGSASEKWPACAANAALTRLPAHQPIVGLADISAACMAHALAGSMLPAAAPAMSAR